MAGLTVNQLAAKINRKNLGAKTLGKVERGERDLEDHEVPVIAKATGVPEWFLQRGFDGEDTEPELAEVVESLSHRVATLEPLRVQVERLMAQMDIITELAEDRTADALGKAGRRAGPSETGGAESGTDHPE